MESDLLKEKQSLESLRARLQVFIDNVDETWVHSVNEWKGRVSYQFNPTWLPYNLTDQYFLSHGQSFVMMSATFPPLPIISKTLGIPFDLLDYKEVKSEFPPANRKVILMPYGDLSYKHYNNSILSIFKGIDYVCNKHPHDKGIIHTVSYKLTKDVMSIDKGRFITHDNTNKDEQFKRFVKATYPAIFVSPSSTRGIDLYDDLCRFSIIPKAPFMYLGDKLVNKRRYGSGPIGYQWFVSDCAQNIVQASGRANRHADDWSITYILDRRAVDLITNNPALFPLWWRQGIV